MTETLVTLASVHMIRVFGRLARTIKGDARQNGMRCRLETSRTLLVGCRHAYEEERDDERTRARRIVRKERNCTSLLSTSVPGNHRSVTQCVNGMRLRADLDGYIDNWQKTTTGRKNTGRIESPPSWSSWIVHHMCRRCANGKGR